MASAGELLGKVDFAIITIRPDEHLAMLNTLGPGEPVEGTRTYRARPVVTTSGVEYTVVTVRCAEQGNGEAQAAARDLIEDLDPRWIIVAGIGGARPATEYSLGDVILATHVHDFSVEAVVKSGREYALSGGPAHPQVRSLVADIHARLPTMGSWNSVDRLGERPAVPLEEDRFYGTAEWINDVKKSLNRNFGFERSAVVWDGAVGSSDRLIKDTEILAVWAQFARQLALVEMESAGVYRAAQRKNKSYPVLTVRAVSDVVGYRRDPDWTEYACKVAASFTGALIRSEPIPPSKKKVIET